MRERGQNEYCIDHRKPCRDSFIHYHNRAIYTQKSACLGRRLSSRNSGDYPPAIREKCIELGLIEKREQRFTRADIIRKGMALVVFVIAFAFVLKNFNRADTLWEGFRDSYLIWLIIDWYDALVLDCIWFCHCRRIRILGPEGMKRIIFSISSSPALACF